MATSNPNPAANTAELHNLLARQRERLAALNTLDEQLTAVDAYLKSGIWKLALPAILSAQQQLAVIPEDDLFATSRHDLAATLKGLDETLEPQLQNAARELLSAKAISAAKIQQEYLAPWLGDPQRGHRDAALTRLAATLTAAAEQQAASPQKPSREFWQAVMDACGTEKTLAKLEKTAKRHLRTGLMRRLWWILPVLFLGVLGVGFGPRVIPLIFPKPTPIPTAIATATLTPTATHTLTPTPTATATATSTLTPTPTATATPTARPTAGKMGCNTLRLQGSDGADPKIKNNTVAIAVLSETVSKKEATSKNVEWQQIFILQRDPTLDCSLTQLDSITKGRLYRLTPFEVVSDTGIQLDPEKASMRYDAATGFTLTQPVTVTLGSDAKDDKGVRYRLEYQEESGSTKWLPVEGLTLVLKWDIKAAEPTRMPRPTPKVTSTPMATPTPAYGTIELVAPKSGEAGQSTTFGWKYTKCLPLPQPGTGDYFRIGFRKDAEKDAMSPGVFTKYEDVTRRDDFTPSYEETGCASTGQEFKVKDKSLSGLLDPDVQYVWTVIVVDKNGTARTDPPEWRTIKYNSPAPPPPTCKTVSTGGCDVENPAGCVCP